MGGHWCPTAQPPPASSALLVGLRDLYDARGVAHYGSTITGYSGSRNRRGYKTRSIPIEHARAQVVRVTRRQPVCESSRRVGRLRGHRLAGARTRTHSRHNDHLWRATGRGSAAGPPRPRHQPAFDSAEANPRDAPPSVPEALEVLGRKSVLVDGRSRNRSVRSSEKMHRNWSWVCIDRRSSEPV